MAILGIYHILIIILIDVWRSNVRQDRWFRRQILSPQDGAVLSANAAERLQGQRQRTRFSCRDLPSGGQGGTLRLRQIAYCPGRRNNRLDDGFATGVLVNKLFKTYLQKSGGFSLVSGIILWYNALNICQIEEKSDDLWWTGKFVLTDDCGR